MKDPRCPACLGRLRVGGAGTTHYYVCDTCRQPVDPLDVGCFFTPLPRRPRVTWVEVLLVVLGGALVAWLGVGLLYWGWR